MNESELRGQEARTRHEEGTSSTRWQSGRQAAEAPAPTGTELAEELHSARADRPRRADVRASHRKLTSLQAQLLRLERENKRLHKRVESTCRGVCEGWS
jgi:hypothetical protein